MNPLVFRNACRDRVQLDSPSQSQQQVARTLHTASHSLASAANTGGQSAMSGKPNAIAVAATNSWTSDDVSAEQQRGGKDDKQTLVEALDSGGPLKLDAMCWFYLDPSVSSTLCILSTFGVRLYACMLVCKQGIAWCLRDSHELLSRKL